MTSVRLVIDAAIAGSLRFLIKVGSPSLPRESSEAICSSFDKYCDFEMVVVHWSGFQHETGEKKTCAEKFSLFPQSAASVNQTTVFAANKHFFAADDEFAEKQEICVASCVVLGANKCWCLRTEVVEPSQLSEMRTTSSTLRLSICVEI